MNTYLFHHYYVISCSLLIPPSTRKFYPTALLSLQDSLLCQAGSKLLQDVFQELVLLLHGLLVIQLPLSGLKEVLLQPLLIQEEVVV